MLPRYFTGVGGVAHTPEMSAAWRGIVAKTYRPSWVNVRLWMLTGQ